MITAISASSHILLLGFDRIVTKRISKLLSLGGCSSKAIGVYKIKLASLVILISAFIILAVSFIITLADWPIDFVMATAVLSILNIFWIFQKSILLAYMNFSTVSIYNFLHNSTHFIIAVLIAIVAADPQVINIIFATCVAKLFFLIRLFVRISDLQIHSHNYVRLPRLCEILAAVSLGINSSLYLAQSSVDKILIERLFGGAALAFFSVGLQAAQKLAILPQAFAAVAYTHQSRSGASKLYYFNKVSVVFAALNIILYLISEPIIKLWLGDINSAVLVKIFPLLVCSMSFCSLNFMITAELEAGRHARACAISEAMLVALYLTLIISFSSTYGVICAAFLLLLKELAALLIKLFFYVSVRQDKGAFWGYAFLLFSTIFIYFWEYPLVSESGVLNVLATWPALP